MSDEVVTENKPKQEITISENGWLMFSNATELASSARILMKMNWAPKHLMSEGLEAVMSALLFCKQHSLPASALNELGYIKGRLTAFGSLVTALAERHSEFGEKEEFFVTSEGERISSENKNLSAKPWAHVIKIKKKGASVWNEYFFSIEDAKQAGLLTQSTSTDSAWWKYTKDMLYHKNKSRALKANYASALNGINYHEDLLHDVKDVTGPSIADELNEYRDNEL